MDDNVEMEQNQEEQNNREDQKDNDFQEDNKEMENEEEGNGMMYIYEWVDQIQLSRSKKNIARDFSDAVLLAEIIKHYLPRLVELHNYPDANSAKLKLVNWETLNKKVLKKIGIKMTKAEINDIVSYKQFAIENLLARVYNAIENTTGINIASGEVKPKPAKDNVNNLEKVLAEKDNNIQQLNDIIQVLEMKLKSSKEMEQTLQNKVDELTNILKSKGFDV